jgi:exodeoxyribonuclease V alpha subunit
MVSIEGTVAHILFANDENAYAVAKIMSSEDNSIFTITGSIAGIQIGEYVICNGDWKNDKKFGLQFSVAAYEVHLPSDLQNIERFLSSGNIAGIGEIIAKRIVSKFEKNTFEIFETAIDRLLEVEGIGQKKLLRIKSSWNEKQNSRELILFFQNYDISPLLVNKILKKYGQDSIQIVTQNPYLLVEDKIGIGFRKADEIAFKMGFSPLSKERISAGILFVLNDVVRKGNTCFPENEFLHLVEITLAVERDLIAIYLEELISEKRIVKKFADEQIYLWPSLLYHEEKNIVRQLDRINSYPILTKKIDFETVFDELGKIDNFFLSEKQKKAVENCFKNQVHIVTGGPGTGKSTIVNVLLKICEKYDLSTVLTAPTGRAAKRMTEITGKNASTLHSLLSLDFSAEKKYSRNKIKIEADFILVDEVSMVDTFLMSCFLETVQVGSRIVFIGDSDQLPSVGPGKVLKDFIDSGMVKVSQLNEIFRQKNFSKIIQNAHLINAGQMPLLSIQKESDFYFIKE